MNIDEDMRKIQWSRAKWQDSEDYLMEYHHPSTNIVDDYQFTHNIKNAH